jgi:hypothetical protein
MAIDTVTPRSRRAVLAASLGGLAAAVAATLGRPAGALAADNLPVNIGQENHGTIETGVVNDDGNETAFYGHVAGGGVGLLGESNTGLGVKGTSNNVALWGQGGVSGVFAQGGTQAIEATSSTGKGVRASSSSGIGVHASSGSNIGVQGDSTSGYGVYGASTSNRGVYGVSTQDIGVYGIASGAGKPGAVGQSAANGTGVFGWSGIGSLPVPPTRTGVYGIATQDSVSRGVYGKSTLGRGVFGEASSGLGVRGYATSGDGLSGEAVTGFALHTKGRLKFEKSGGIATIAAGTSTVTVTPGIDLTATTVVIATLQGDAGGTTAVKRVVIDTAANTFRIILTANTVNAVNAGWFAFG